MAHRNIKMFSFFLSFTESDESSAQLTDSVLGIHSAYQLIATECYNQKINEPFDRSQYSTI